MNIQPSQRSIDSSLARSIRRGYFRRLAREWAAYDQRRGRAAGRNVSLTAWMVRLWCNCAVFPATQTSLDSRSQRMMHEMSMR